MTIYYRNKNSKNAKPLLRLFYPQKEEFHKGPPSPPCYQIPTHSWTPTTPWQSFVYTRNSSFGCKIISKCHSVDRSRSALFNLRDKLPILWLLYFSFGMTLCISCSFVPVVLVFPIFIPSVFENVYSHCI